MDLIIKVPIELKRSQTLQIPGGFRVIGMAKIENELNLFVATSDQADTWNLEIHILRNGDQLPDGYFHSVSTIGTEIVENEHGHQEMVAVVAPFKSFTSNR